MRKRILFCFVASLFFLTDAFAHKLILGVYGNGDDTITIEGKYDTGASAAGALVRLESLNSGEVLFRERLPRKSELTVKIPDEPYQVVLDGGPGHLSVKEGIPPASGFSAPLKENPKAKPSGAAGLNRPLAICVGLAFCLLLLTIFIGIHNTNRILAAIDKASASGPVPPTPRPAVNNEARQSDHSG
jgi:hypothetical protein